MPLGALTLCMLPERLDAHLLNFSKQFRLCDRNRIMLDRVMGAWETDLVT